MKHASSVVVLLLAGACGAVSCDVRAATSKIPFSSVNAEGIDKGIGSIVAIDTPEGLKLTPNLRALPPGQHGFHVHVEASCEALPDPDRGRAMTPALGAGAYLDADATVRHDGPDRTGHKGDLPSLIVAANGKATRALVAPRLTVADIKNRALVVQAGDPGLERPGASGGARIACGVAP